MFVVLSWFCVEKGGRGERVRWGGVWVIRLGLDPGRYGLLGVLPC